MQSRIFKADNHIKCLKEQNDEDKVTQHTKGRINLKKFSTKKSGHCDNFEICRLRHSSKMRKNTSFNLLREHGRHSGKRRFRGWPK